MGIVLYDSPTSLIQSPIDFPTAGFPDNKNAILYHKDGATITHWDIEPKFTFQNPLSACGYKDLYWSHAR